MLIWVDGMWERKHAAADCVAGRGTRDFSRSCPDGDCEFLEIRFNKACFGLMVLLEEIHLLHLASLSVDSHVQSNPKTAAHLMPISIDVVRQPRQVSLAAWLVKCRLPHQNRCFSRPELPTEKIQ